MIDSALMEKAFKELKVGAKKRDYVLEQLTQIGQDAQSNLDTTPIRNSSKLLKDLKAMDGDLGRLLKRFGIDGDSHELDAALTSSKAVVLAITNYGENIHPNRYKHWPLDDKICRDRLDRLFSDIQIFRSSTVKSIEEISGRTQEGRGGRRRTIDWILQETAWHLLRLYYEETERKPGVSKPPGGGKPCGPVVRFLNYSLKAYGLDLKPSTAANLINKLKSDPELPWNQASID